MPENANTPLAPCSVCGERPGTLHMVVATENGREGAALCQPCAREIMEGFDAAGRGPRGLDRAPQPQSQHPRAPPPPHPPPPPAGDPPATPALDEFGRDLTRDAAEGRIDPVVGREEEI